MDRVRAVSWLGWAAVALTLVAVAATRIVWPQVGFRYSLAEFVIPAFGPGFLAGLGAGVGYATLPATRRVQARPALVGFALGSLTPVAIVLVYIIGYATMGAT